MSSKVHRVRFYNPKPQGINCVSFTKHSKLIAVARADVSIEVWDLNYAPYPIRLIPGLENGSVEALGWVGDRLLSTGLGGALVEWDITKLCQKHSILLTGYAAWCLDVNSAETLVAVGTEQGYINLYSVENDEIVYQKLFDKQDGRIVSCKFDITGSTLVTGSVDNIRVWNVETGHVVTRISVSRRKKEVIVWSLAVLNDNVIVSGDSQGRLTFWDGNIGEQIESFTSHKADILSITVSEDGNNIYCSGMDPTISHFVKVVKSKGKGKSDTQWVKNVQRHIHQHDVRALVLNGNVLVSVGVDGYLTFSMYPPKWVVRVPPMMPDPRSSVCTSKKLLLLRYSNYLEVWKLGSYAINNGHVEITTISSKVDKSHNQNNSIEEDTTVVQANNELYNEKHTLKVTENPIKLVSVQAKHKKQIQCCEISPSGEFIVYATDSDLRMLRLENDDSEEDQSNISLSKVLINGVSSPCYRVVFTEDSRTIVALCGDSLQILQVNPDADATVVQTIVINKFSKMSSIIHLLVSKKTASGATYIVVADRCSIIEVLIEKKKFVPYATLPKYKFVPTAMTVDHKRETLIVIYSDHKVIEYDLIKKRVTDWPSSALPQQWYDRTSPATSAALHPRRDALVLCDHTAVWVIDRSAQMEQDEPDAKRKPHGSWQLHFNVIPIKYLAGFHWVGDDEAVILEVLPENIVSQLPAPVQLNNWRK